MYRKPYELLKRPMVSEKTAPMADAAVYVFEVAADASKTELKAAFESLFYGRTVSKVRTAKIGTYRKRVGMRQGQVPAGKKAYFTVAGAPIELFAAQ